MYIHRWHPCWSVQRPYRASRHVAIIIAQQPAETIVTPHLPPVASKVRYRCDKLVVEPLMVALRMIVRQVLVDRIRQSVFTQYNHLRERLLLDGAHEPLAMGVQIRTPRW